METLEGTTFGGDHLSKALATLVLPELATDFRGDLLGLVVLDIFAFRHQLPFSLSSAWGKLHTVKAISNFIINCGVGQGIEMVEESIAAIITWLESKLRTSLGRQLDTRSRSSLIAVLKEVQLDAQLIGDISETYMHGKLFSERDSKEEQHDRQYLCRELIGVAIETAENGPSAKFCLEYHHDWFEDYWASYYRVAESEIGAGEENGSDEKHLSVDGEQGDDAGYNNIWENDDSDDIYDDHYDDDHYSYRSAGSVS